ncbi:hypothetical protein F4604DRAFT_1920959 [Suillus subluteus]|nr:hypothetical protein F4604DRAFT_1920959 [Suillus subluteus]
MPVIQPPRPCCSVRLKQLQMPSKPMAYTPQAMDNVRGPVTRGHTPKLVVQWQAGPGHTQKVIEYLCANSPDCQVLFYSDWKQAHTQGDRPSGKDKLSICAVIAKHIFQKDPDYLTQYAEVLEKFHDSMNNHITSLKKKYRECYDKLHLTGAGVMPNDKNAAQNLHAQILQTFPWYDELVSILGTNPALSLKTVSSHPGTDHAANFFAITQAWSAQTSSADSGSAHLAPSGPQPAPSSSQPAPSSFQPSPSSSQPAPPSSQPAPHNFQPAPSSYQFTPSSYQFGPPPGTECLQFDQSPNSAYSHSGTVPIHHRAPPPLNSNMYHVPPPRL